MLKHYDFYLNLETERSFELQSGRDGDTGIKYVSVLLQVGQQSMK